MTHVIRTYSTEGSTALVPSCSPLVLLDGGAGKRDADSPRHARRTVCEEQQSSRRDVVTVLVCTFFVAAGLFCVLVARTLSALLVWLRRSRIFPPRKLPLFQAIPFGALRRSIMWMATVPQNLLSGLPRRTPSTLPSFAQDSLCWFPPLPNTRECCVVWGLWFLLAAAWTLLFEFGYLRHLYDGNLDTLC